MLRFVVLRHEPTAAGAKPLHWDLMLEHSGALRTWSLGVEPVWNTPIPAEQLSDHRLAFLEYEGLLTGDRGNVTRWDSGTYEPDHESDHELRIEMHGSTLNGRLTLRRSLAEPQRWMAEFSRDDSTGIR